MGQSPVKSSSDSQASRTKFNFSGIKEISKHPYLSCLCKQNEIVHNSGPETGPNPFLPSQRNSRKNPSNKRQAAATPRVESSRNSEKSSFKTDTPLATHRVTNNRSHLYRGAGLGSVFQSTPEADSPNLHQQIKPYMPKGKNPVLISSSFKGSSNRNSLADDFKKKEKFCVEKDEFGQLGVNESIQSEKKFTDYDQIVDKESEISVASLKETSNDAKTQFADEANIGGGRKYTGEIMNGVPHGVGKEVWSDGSSYTGTYKLGSRTGQGIFIWPDKSTYQGAFANNEMQGFGTFTWSNGNIYTGSWCLSKMHGEGKYIWPNGNYYIGSYFEGLKHGFGTFTYRDGRTVKGSWEHGELQENV